MYVVVMKELQKATHHNIRKDGDLAGYETPRVLSLERALSCTEANEQSTVAPKIPRGTKISSYEKAKMQVHIIQELAQVLHTRKLERYLGEYDYHDYRYRSRSIKHKSEIEKTWIQKRTSWEEYDFLRQQFDAMKKYLTSKGKSLDDTALGRELKAISTSPDLMPAEERLRARKEVYDSLIHEEEQENYYDVTVGSRLARLESKENRKMTSDNHWTKELTTRPDLRHLYARSTVGQLVPQMSSYAIKPGKSGGREAMHGEEMRDPPLDYHRLKHQVGTRSARKTTYARLERHSTSKHRTTDVMRKYSVAPSRPWKHLKMRSDAYR